ncbi:MAG: YlmC/YmxH family sporulation protein [Ruminococcus sp.]|nr:YlmC/YmxH family sporulation protein [Ruminococcus sp.]
MLYSLSQIKNKEVVDVKTGVKIGYVDDAEIDTASSSVVSLLVFGRPRFMGIFGREDDIVIKCDDIELIGEDTILVNFKEKQLCTKSKSYTVENLFK